MNEGDIQIQNGARRARSLREGKRCEEAKDEGYFRIGWWLGDFVDVTAYREYQREKLDHSLIRRWGTEGGHPSEGNDQGDREVYRGRAATVSTVALAQIPKRFPATTGGPGQQLAEEIWEETVIEKGCLICGASIRVSGDDELFNSDLCCNECVAYLEGVGESPAELKRSIAAPEKAKRSRKKTRIKGAAV